MARTQKITIFLLRIALGWLFFYAGVTKVLNPSWSAAGYLNGAKNFVGLYRWFVSPGVLPTINFLNEWGLTLIGVSLILGALVKWSSPFGVLIMALYYFALPFPQQSATAYLVDEHVMYSLIFILLYLSNAGKIYGIDRWFSK